jgi:hypothetical protein
LQKYQQLLARKIEVTSNIADLNLKIERNSSVVVRTKNDLENYKKSLMSMNKTKKQLKTLKF